MTPQQAVQFTKRKFPNAFLKMIAMDDRNLANCKYLEEKAYLKGKKKKARPSLWRQNIEN